MNICSVEVKKKKNGKKLIPQYIYICVICLRHYKSIGTYLHTNTIAIGLIKRLRMVRAVCNYKLR